MALAADARGARQEWSPPPFFGRMPSLLLVSPLPEITTAVLVAAAALAPGPAQLCCLEHGWERKG